MEDDKNYINPRPEEEAADDLLREVVGDYLHDSKKKKNLNEEQAQQQQ